MCGQDRGATRGARGCSSRGIRLMIACRGHGPPCRTKRSDSPEMIPCSAERL